MKVNHINCAYQVGDTLFVILKIDQFAAALLILGKSATVDEAVQELFKKNISVKVYHLKEFVPKSDTDCNDSKVVDEYLSKDEVIDDIRKMSFENNTRVRFPLWIGAYLVVEHDGSMDISIQDDYDNVLCMTSVIDNICSFDTIWEKITRLVTDCYYKRI